MERDKKNIIILFGLIGVILFFIMYIAPLNSDDFEFAGFHFKTWEAVINHSLFYGNGRLLGNIGACILNNSTLLRAVTKTLVICGIIFITPKTLKLTGSGWYLLSAILILGVGPEIFSQVFTWTSGFQNYVPPILCFMLCIYIVQENHTTVYKLSIIITLSIIGALYVEHFTVIHLLTSFLYWIYYRKKQQEIQKRKALAWWISCFLGLSIMVMIPRIFYKSVNRVTGYRQVHISNIADIITSVKGSIFMVLNTYSHCIIFWLLLSILGILLLKQNKNKMINKKIIYTFRKYVYVCYPIILVLFEYLSFENTNVLRIIRHTLVIGGMCIYLILFAIQICQIKCSEIRNELLFYLILSIASVAPFMIISPFGERCMFLSYFLGVLLIMKGMNYCISSSELVISKKWIQIGWLSLTILLAFLVVNFIDIKKYDDKRNKYIEQRMMKGETEISIYEIPSRYVFPTYLINQYYYYKEPGDIKFELMTYEEWNQKIQHNHK